MQQAFVIRPFGTRKVSTRDDGEVDVNFDDVHRVLIAEALKQAGLGGGTTGEIIESGNVREDMFALIIAADLVICDITLHNANVFYELGIRHALRKKRTILIRARSVKDPPPFDVLTDRYLTYPVTDPAEACEALANAIRATLTTDHVTDSPVFKLLPTLPEADPAKVQVFPRDFVEEVERARAVRSAGWLGLLSSEAATRPFQWPALRLIGPAQLELKDFDGARSTLERIRDNDPDDPAANLALSNVYQRLFRDENEPRYLEASNQAIERVLSSPKATKEQLSETKALKGRNLKTMWQQDFSAKPDLVECRAAATNRALRETYEAYYSAFLLDLNNYWPGLAALQQGTIAADLARDPPWQWLFDTPAQAASHKEELERQLELLRPCVTLSISAALARATNWSLISDADFKFLTEQQPERVIRAYRDAVRRDDFLWDSARRQLELFASLGMKAELATKIITTIDAQVGRGKAKPRQHLVIFAGHRIDEPGRSAPRFPAEREGRARELIAAALKEAQEGFDHLTVLASAAPGSDIICHEVCQKLGIESTICLPMPRDVVAAKIFGAPDRWRGRYLNLLSFHDAAHRPVFELSDRDGLPRWLEGSGIDPWERGNRWVLEMARASGAAQTTLIVLWDGNLTAGDRGGTGHMVQIVQETPGRIGITEIKTVELLA
jgi:tetratricopeptide (TPR) repeat protein